MMFALGTIVRYARHHPGGAWDGEPWRICGRTIIEDEWRQPVIQYSLVRVADVKRHWIECCVREEQLMPWHARYSVAGASLAEARAVYLSTKNKEE